MIAILASASLAAGACDASWPLWDRYVEGFVSADGRVIDRTAGDRTTSEGQAYALFFSLVSNDRALFERVLRWTEQNLAQADLRRSLPAWHWGRRREGAWGILDRNPASDADLWLAYALLEAGRAWSERRYVTLGEQVLANAAAREVVSLPGFGPSLLQGPAGFAAAGGFRVNPSYAPPPLLRRFARAGAPWDGVLASSTRMLRLFAEGAAAPDWALARAGRLFPDPVHGRVASYDAIRVPLWVGMTPDRDAGLERIADGLFRALESNGRLPERLDARTLQGRGEAPPGFYGALLPLAPRPARAVLEARLAASWSNGLYGSPPAYYDQNLVLFGQGFVEGRYHFATDGSLVLAWETRCLGRAR